MYGYDIGKCYCSHQGEHSKQFDRLAVIQIDVAWCLHLNTLCYFAIYFTSRVSVVNKHNKELRTKPHIADLIGKKIDIFFCFCCDLCLNAVFIFVLKRSICVVFFISFLL